MNEMEKIAELYLDTAYELEKAAAEEGVDLDEVIEDMDDEEVAELLDAAVEDRLDSEGYEDDDYDVEASAFMFKTAELLEKAAGPRVDAARAAGAKHPVWTGMKEYISDLAGHPIKTLKEGKTGRWLAAKAEKYPKTTKWLKRGGVAGVGAGAVLGAQALRRRRNKRG